MKHPRNILIKLTKIKHKEQILKAAREKQQITHKGIPIRITADLSIETLQARRERQDIVKMMKKPALKDAMKSTYLENQRNYHLQNGRLFLLLAIF